MKNKKFIIDAVGSSFMRVMKNENCLSIFKKSLYEYVRTNNEEFGDCHSFSELMEKIYILATHNPQKIPNSNPKYERITTMINLLLHYFLENKGVSYQLLGGYGQRIFDLSCYKIFGEEYEEDKKEINIDQNELTDPLDQFIFNLFMKERENNPNLSWETFYQKAKNHFSIIFKQN